MKIPIKRHTPVRRPKSRYKLFLEDTGGSISFRNGTSVTDLTTGLENPLDIKARLDKLINEYMTVSKVPKYDWTEWHEDMNKQVKPSLWQRIKRYYKEGLSDE